MAVNQIINNEYLRMRFDTAPISYRNKKTGKVLLQPLKKQIDRRVDKILTYLTQSQTITQQHAIQCQIQNKWADVIVPVSSKKQSRNNSAKINLSQYLERQKLIQNVDHQAITHIDQIKQDSPVRERIMRLNSETSHNSEESISKKNIQEESFSRIFGNDQSMEMPQPFSLNINLDNITNRSFQMSRIGHSIRSTERSLKKKIQDKENQFHTPCVSNSKKSHGIIHRTPSCSTIKRQFQPDGRPTNPCVDYNCYKKMMGEVEKQVKKSRKQANENNLRNRFLIKISKIPCSSATRIPTSS